MNKFYLENGWVREERVLNFEGFKFGTVCFVWMKGAERKIVFFHSKSCEWMIHQETFESRTCF